MKEFGQAGALRHSMLQLTGGSVPKDWQDE
jgi:hypothetical protein